MEMKTVFGSMMDFDNASRPEGPDPIQPIEEEEPVPKKKQRLPEILDLNDFPDASDEDEAGEESNDGSYNPFRGVSFEEPKEEPKEEPAPAEEDPAEEDEGDLFLSEDLFAKEEPKEGPEEGNGAKMTDGFVVRGEHAEIVVTADHARVDSKLSGTVTCHSLTVGNAGIEGKIYSDADVVLSNLADVRGEIHAKKIEVYGTFHGTLSAEEELVVHDSARVFGTMESFGSVEIHPGAVLSGTASFRTKEDEGEEDEDAFLLSEPEESVPDTKELFPIEEEKKEKKAPASKKEPEQEPVMDEDEDDEPDLVFDETDESSNVTKEEPEEEPVEEPDTEEPNEEEDPAESESNKEVPEEENQPQNIVVPDDTEDSDDLDDVDLPSSFFDEAEV